MLMQSMPTQSLLKNILQKFKDKTAIMTDGAGDSANCNSFSAKASPVRSSAFPAA
ncbi:MAG: hypothetical protein ACKVOY_12970 [Burkholderiaceae bacterium]